MPQFSSGAGTGICVALTATPGCDALYCLLGSVGGAMNSSTGILDVTDQDIFGEEISDAALEIAGAMVRDCTASLTIAFCSGLDECPRHGQRSGARYAPLFAPVAASGVGFHSQTLM